MSDCNVYSGSDFEVPSLRAFQGSFLKVCEHFFLMGCVGSLSDCDGSNLNDCMGLSVRDCEGSSLKDFQGFPLGDYEGFSMMGFLRSLTVRAPP